MVTLPHSAPSLPCLVSHIFSMRAGEQVARVAAHPIVAPVKNVKIIQGAMMTLKGDAVGLEDNSTPVRHAPIPV